MAFNLNQFKLSNIEGMTMNPEPNVISAQVLPTLAAASYYQAGQVVAFGTNAGDMPIIRAINTGCGIGVIAFNAKKSKYYANDICSVALDGTIITVKAASAITRNDVLAYGSTGMGTITTGNGIGIALDNASASGDIVRMMVKAHVCGSANLY